MAKPTKSAPAKKSEKRTVDGLPEDPRNQQLKKTKKS
jgi:hypothetical protein